MITDGLMSSESAEHYTPPDFLELVAAVAPIGLDPCWSPKSLVRARVALSSDGLKLNWICGDDDLIFVNPPYGRGVGQWTSRCVSVAGSGATVLALLPARTDSAWFQAAAPTVDAACFLRGRLRFWTAEWCATCQKPGRCPSKKGHVTREIDAAMESGPAPFPSVALFWGRHLVPRFREVFGRRGLVVS